jgi:nucleolar complex protein 2
MKKKANKATRKFAAKGQLKKTIQTRQKHQQFKKKVQGRRGKGFGRRTENVEGGEEEDSLNGAQKAPKYVFLCISRFLAN